MKKLVLFILFISVFIFSCKKDEPEPMPPAGPSYQILTGTVANITNTAAIVTGSISNVKGTSITSFGHVWSTSPNPATNLSTKTTFGPVNADTSFTSNLTMLQQGTVYYIRAYTTDSQRTFYGQATSFTTAASFFEFVVSSNYLTANSLYTQRCWVMIYNADKELLGIEEILNGSTYTFDWSANKKADKYMVQLMRYTDYIDTTVYDDSYNLSCYLNVEPEVWYLGSEPDNQYTQIGTNTVTLLDIDLYNYDYWVTQNQYTWAGYDNTSQTLIFPQYFDPDKIWIKYNNEDEAPFYKWIDNVGLNESFTVSSSDFTQMTNYVDISLPQNTNSFVYIESEDDLATDYWEWFEIFYQSSDSMTTVRTYYPDNLFAGYFTYMRVRNDNISEFMYKYRGAIPTQFVSLPVNVSVINEDIHNFSATYTGEADIISSFWTYVEEKKSFQSFGYYIYGEANDLSPFSAPALPGEITILNESLLDISKLMYSGSYFREYNYYSGYDDYINKSFVQPGISPGDYEYYYSKSIYKEYYKVSDLIDDREEIQRIKRDSFNY